ncbi:ABC transporter permease [Gordonia sp. PP30]|uniref:ABC transporter permease n=1 Tax=Gordonia sp. PP30 TaxID=2935861 RepID=UPI002000500B|nr:ABC transporter permease [Gordonia sp. PP30]UQE73659.1 ABC transporter permease [Gordonia sp. PP30]
MTTPSVRSAPALSGPFDTEETTAAAVAPPRSRFWRARRTGWLLARRTLLAIPSVVAISFAIFAVAAASPFDPLTAYLGGRYQNATVAQREMMTAAYHTDQSWVAAWWQWWVDLFHGRLGFSSTQSQPVTTVLAERLPFTFSMALISLLLAAAISLVLGAVIGMRRGGLLDRGCSALAALAASTPPFVVSLVLVVVFAVTLGWFPTSGARAPGDEYTAIGLIAHGVLPTIALTVSMIPWMLLTMRAAVVEATGSDAVFAARARGVDKQTLLLGHIAPMSALPTVALIGTRLPELLAGAAIVEAVFGWPGLAQALVESAVALDFPLLAALAVGSAVLVLAGSALSDAAAVWLDPRIEMTA